MQTKLFILQEVDKIKGNSNLIGVFNFIEDATEQIGKITPIFEHSKFVIYESMLGSGKSKQIKTITCRNISPEITYL